VANARFDTGWGLGSEFGWGEWTPVGRHVPRLLEVARLVAVLVENFHRPAVPVVEERSDKLGGFDGPVAPDESNPTALRPAVVISETHQSVPHLQDVNRGQMLELGRDVRRRLHHLVFVLKAKNDGSLRMRIGDSHEAREDCMELRIERILEPGFPGEASVEKFPNIGNFDGERLGQRDRPTCSRRLRSDTGHLDFSVLMGWWG
jgi:hypothetical protein